jgi:hypothetical protein
LFKTRSISKFFFKLSLFLATFMLLPAAYSIAMLDSTKGRVHLLGKLQKICGLKSWISASQPEYPVSVSGGGPVTRRLCETFDKAVRSRCSLKHE